MLNYSDSTHRIINGDKNIPVIAFFGTKGGVGKTTIVDKFSTLVSRASKKPNVLMVDFDVHHRGLTVLRTRDRITESRTIHEYLADDNLEFQKAQDVASRNTYIAQGREFLIPSSNLAAERVFSAITRLDPNTLLERLTRLFTTAAKQYDIDLILIDCGPIVDPLTASAAFMADMAFIIGQNEPITFQSLQNYAIRIRDFLPTFDAAKVRVILNKVRGPVLQKVGVFAALPFTMEVVDYSEGLPDIDEIRLIYLDYCIYEIVKRVFSPEYESLIPSAEAVLTQNQKDIVDTIEKFPSSKWFQRLQKTKLLFIGGLVSFASALVAYLAPKILESLDISKYQWLETLPAVLFTLGLILTGLGLYLYLRLRSVNGVILLKQKYGYEGLLELLTTREKRQKFNDIRKWSERTRKEIPNES